MAKLTVAIPTHEMEGGAGFLKSTFILLANQTFRDFDVVVSDNSDNDVIRNICHDSSGMLDITWYRNPNKGMAPNTNFAISKSKGELVKILYLDDYLNGFNALEEIVENFEPSDHWLVTGCLHNQGGVVGNPHYPLYNDEIWTGKNTIGSPSVLTIRKETAMYFDENLTWLLDCDLYHTYYKKYGTPRVLNSLNVVIRQGDHQVTNLLSDQRKIDEYYYLHKKYTECQSDASSRVRADSSGHIY